ncbi:hypothetical protein CPB83DRAFT_831767 [Crepidotus variabilis]|uniref:Uncharacterized protein n=1 Tax=Crepidotus variabilis TaxID=179855 RepID=A0A9P6ESQ4_9AGAR|nr:hypothetical protein CPB83DRAFT_831767 [Crepidotus variabilis]
MNTYQAIPNCFEVKDTVNDSPGYFSARVVHHRTGLYSALFGQEHANTSNPEHFHLLLEAAVSPAKYAVFLYIGAALLENTRSCSSPSSSLIIKIGALGGMVLALLYFTLLLRNQKTNFISTSGPESISPYTICLCKEVVYSTLAALIGCWGYGLSAENEVQCFILSGAIGPMIFAAVGFALLVTLLSAVRGIEKIQDWCAGY